MYFPGMSLLGYEEIDLLGEIFQIAEDSEIDLVYYSQLSGKYSDDKAALNKRLDCLERSGLITLGSGEGEVDPSGSSVRRRIWMPTVTLTEIGKCVYRL